MLGDPGLSDRRSLRALSAVVYGRHFSRVFHHKILLRICVKITLEKLRASGSDCPNTRSIDFLCQTVLASETTLALEDELEDAKEDELATVYTDRQLGISVCCESPRIYDEEGDVHAANVLEESMANEEGVAA